MKKTVRMSLIILALMLAVLPTISYANNYENERIDIVPNGPVKPRSYPYKERIPLYGSRTINSRLWRKIYVSEDGYEEGYYEGYIYLKRKEGTVWAYFEGTLSYSGTSMMKSNLEFE
ncbi:hypothetical protein [Helcococcus sueciensis]|uniref:hypothetical protein n=1 Tax=Helcococcus sueciensis TaxID=241555 RepID=UPI00040E3ED2|nr:hypothetical protein [Helcococcus sueciensis]